MHAQARLAFTTAVTAADQLSRSLALADESGTCSERPLIQMGSSPGCICCRPSTMKIASGQPDSVRASRLCSCPRACGVPRAKL